MTDSKKDDGAAREPSGRVGWESTLNVDPKNILHPTTMAGATEINRAAMGVKVNACQAHPRNAQEEAYLADIVAAAIRYMRGENLMIKPGFTPGPWLVIDRLFEDDRYYIVPRAAFEPDAVRFKFWKAGDQIASLYVDSDVDSDKQRVAKADADLIAAAPNLYAVVKLLEHGKASDTCAGCPVCEVALESDNDKHRAGCALAAALAKAEGRSAAQPPSKSGMKPGP